MSHVGEVPFSEEEAEQQGEEGNEEQLYDWHPFSEHADNLVVLHSQPEVVYLVGSVAAGEDFGRNPRVETAPVYGVVLGRKQQSIGYEV